MIKQEEVFRIGRLGKPHGVKGEVTMLVDDDVFDRVDAEYLILKVDGILVPFFMEEYRFKTDTTALIKFEDVDTVERARELTNCEVFFPRRLADNDEEDYTWSFFVGFELIDDATGQSVGHITDIDETTANVLFCLDNGMLIPATDDLVVSIDDDAQRITMRLPDGLLDIG